MSAVSCSFTDLEPTDKVGDKEIFSSVTTLEQALTGTYSKMSMKTTISVSAVLSDDVYKGGQNGGYLVYGKIIRRKVGGMLWR